MHAVSGFVSYNLVWSVSDLLRGAPAPGSWSWLHLPVLATPWLGSGSWATLLFLGRARPGLLATLGPGLASAPRPLISLWTSSSSGSWAAPGPASLPAARPGSRPFSGAPGPAPSSGPPASWPTPGVSLPPAVIHNLDPTSVKLRVVQLVNRVADILVPGELHNPLVPACLVSISIGHLAGAPHEVLQVLPAHPGGQVLDDDPVLSPGGRTILLQPDRPVAVPASSSSSSTVTASAPGPPAVGSASPPVLVSAVRSSLGQLAGHPIAKKVGPVKIIDSVIRVTVVLKLDECIPEKLKYYKGSPDTCESWTYLLLIRMSLILPYFLKNLSTSFSRVLGGMPPR